MSKTNVQIESQTPSINLLQCAIALKEHNPETRKAAAAIICSYDYAFHIGGRHVAILDGDNRLAVVTSDAEDFN